MRFNAFDFQKGSGFYGYLSADFDNNTVIRKAIIDEILVRETTFANVNGTYQLNGYISANKKVKIDSLRMLSFDFGMESNIIRSVNFNNGINTQVATPQYRQV